MQYFIIELDNRTDGLTNVTTTGRSNLQMGLSFFYERLSKMAADTTFTAAHLLLVDEQGVIVKKEDIATAYVPPTETEGETEATEGEA